MRYKQLLCGRPHWGRWEKDKKMKNLKIFIILCVIFSFYSCESNKTTVEKNSYQINLDEKYLIRNNEYYINGKFNFTIKAGKPINGVFVVITPNKLEFENLIGKNPDNTIFSVGNMLIKEKSTETILYYNTNLVNNYLSANDENGSTNFSIPIKGILSMNSSQNNLKLFCYSFCDLNNNSKIEKNEIQIIIINYSISDNIKNEKIHISTVGYKVKSLKKIENDYIIYKIKSYENFIKFKANVTPNVSNFDLLFDKKADFKNDVNYYIIHSPITKNIFLSQPYKYVNSDLLIFDAESNENSDVEYVAARNYMVKKNDDTLKICINLNGKLIFPTLIEY